jgi:hypothetical protein
MRRTSKLSSWAVLREQQARTPVILAVLENFLGEIMMSCRSSATLVLQGTIRRHQDKILVWCVHKANMSRIWGRASALFVKGAITRGRKGKIHA